MTKSLLLPSPLLLGSVRAAARMVEQEAKMGLWGSPGILPASTPTHTPHTIYLTALGTLQHRYLGELSMCHTQLPVPRGYQSPNEVSLKSWTSQPGIVCNSNLLQCLCSFLTYLLSISTKNTQYSRALGTAGACASQVSQASQASQSLVLVTLSGTGQAERLKGDSRGPQLVTFVPLLLT